MNRNTRRVYFARAMDGIAPDRIRGQALEVEEVLAAHGIQLLDPYRDESGGEAAKSLGDRAREIVERDLTLLRNTDAVLMDCSIAEHNYVGCICELVYAYCWKIPIVVFVGNSGNERRIWLQYHATHLCKTRDEAITKLLQILEN
jgi:nucleoside 2-deoxyribosyltransferase